MTSVQCGAEPSAEITVTAGRTQMHTAFLIPLLITLLIVTATAIVAGYATVFAAYWFELRSTERHGGRPDMSPR
ncbi:hypothetical protein [Nocardia sp. NPDC057455]|uniref:hypothetical protein n=1 Tax=Nocardia sp. NPDC057455 TaxID=3346138 RepID=UPI00366D46E0